MFSQHFELAAIVTAQKNFGPGFGSQKLDRLRACDRPIKFEISGFCKLQTAFFLQRSTLSARSIMFGKRIPVSIIRLK